MPCKTKLSAFARQRLDEQFKTLSNNSNLIRPPRGWVRAIRDALGMTSLQLGRRLGVSQARCIQIERAELEGSLTINSLEKVAQALGCTLVYALVPNTPLEQMVRTQAEKNVRTQLDGAPQADITALVDAQLTANPNKLWSNLF